MCANWVDDLQKKAESAWNQNKDKLQPYIDSVTKSAQKGYDEYNSTKNIDDSINSAKDEFQTDVQNAQQQSTQTQGTIQQQAQQKLTQFTSSQSATSAQKSALNGLYQQQQYQMVVTIIDQTNDIFAMLGRISDAVKKQNENALAQMGDAFSQVTMNNVVTVTNKVYTYVKGIAPPAPVAPVPTPTVNSMSDADLKKKVLAIVKEEYDKRLQLIEDMQKQQNTQIQQILKAQQDMQKQQSTQTQQDMQKQQSQNAQTQQSNNMFFNNSTSKPSSQQNMFG